MQMTKQTQTTRTQINDNAVNDTTHTLIAVETKEKLAAISHFPIQKRVLPRCMLSAWDYACSALGISYCIIRGYAGVSNGFPMIEIGYKKEQESLTFNAMALVNGNVVLETKNRGKCNLIR
ncbi:MAG: hypothetical protein K6G10_01535 [Butyrivibrio sp.]|nr:hypothetical protein [Butyrivibrio sp.]